MSNRASPAMFDAWPAMPAATDQHSRESSIPAKRWPPRPPWQGNFSAEVANVPQTPPPAVMIFNASPAADIAPYATSGGPIARLRRLATCKDARGGPAFRPGLIRNMLCRAAAHRDGWQALSSCQPATTHCLPSPRQPAQVRAGLSRRQSVGHTGHRRQRLLTRIRPDSCNATVRREAADRRDRGNHPQRHVDAP